MEKIIAYCGLVCSDCAAYIATQKNSLEEREKVAEKWKEFEPSITADDINCDGCLGTTGRLIKYCTTCKVRECGVSKNVKNCAYCDTYPCDTINTLHKDIPDGKKILDEIRKGL